MASKKSLYERIDNLRDQLEEKRDTVQKYVGAHAEQTESTYRSRYNSESMTKSWKTTVLVRRDDSVSTITLDGKWTIEQIKEAANG